MDKVQLGNVLRERRIFLKLTQQDLAEMARTTPRTIYQVENGEGNPSLDTLTNITDVLGVELNIELKRPRL